MISKVFFLYDLLFLYKCQKKRSSTLRKTSQELKFFEGKLVSPKFPHIFLTKNQSAPLVSKSKVISTQKTISLNNEIRAEHVENKRIYKSQIS